MPCLRSMQTTNRYEHSLDSAMRPVRPDGISRRIRENPCCALPICMRLRAAATRPPRPLRSEREDLERDPSALPDALPIPVKRSISPRSTRSSSLSDPGSGGAPLALPRTRSLARAGSQRAALAASISSHCREERPARRPPPRGDGGARSLLSSRLSASTEPQTSSPSSNPRRRPLSRRRDWLGLS